MVLKNSWERTIPICADCGDKMILGQKGNEFFYECPACKRKFDITLFEKILDNIAKLDAQRFEANELYSIQGEKFKISNKLKCEIVEEGEMFNKWKVSVKVIL